MENEFVSYNESLILKELGFDEPCFGFYLNGKVRLDGKIEHCLSQERVCYIYNANCLVPTFSQAFDWFEKKYGLYHAIHPEFYADGINFNWNVSWYLPKEKWTKNTVSDGTYWYGDNGEYPTRRDAELGVLRKMIEKVKEK